MYRYLRVKLYVTEIQQIYFSVLYNTVHLQTTGGSSLRWVSRRELGNRSTTKNYLFQSPDDIIQVFYGINVSFTIYSITGNLSKTLQSQAILAVEAQKTTKLSLETLERMRSQENSDALFDTVKLKVKKIDVIEEPSLPEKSEYRTTGHWSNTLMFMDWHQNL